MIKVQRYSLISAMKVFGILVVVLGHSMILYQDSWGIFTPVVKSSQINIIKSYIDIFQMPLFTMISGYLFYNTLERKKYKTIKMLIIDKFKRLIIPFIVVALLYVIPIRLFVEYDNYNSSIKEALKLFLLGQDMGHLWFLLMIFWVFIIFYLVLKLKMSYKCNILICIVMYFISSQLPSILQIKRALYYIIYFNIGFLINKYRNSIKLKNSHMFLLIMISIISWMVRLVTNGSEKYMILNYLLYLISSSSIVIVIYELFTRIKWDIIIEKPIIRIIDKYNFGIYLFHEPIIYIIYYYFASTIMNPYLMIIICYFISITISLIITKVIRVLNLNFILGEIR